MDIQLNFINRLNGNAVDVVIFQKNLAVRLNSLAVAWQVILNSAPGSVTPFTFSTALEVAASDSYGDVTALSPANAGQMFHVSQTQSGVELSYVGPAESGKNIVLRNDLPTGSINANVYRAGKLLATKTSIGPKQTASFRFNPTIWVGVVSEVQEGQIMNSVILSSINTQISLLGIASANIIMTGGGQGSSAVPFKFRLQNVKRVG